MYENDTAVVVEEEDAIMPEGWQEGDDIFSEADSSLSGLADESGEEEHDEAEQDATTPQSQAPTTEPEKEDGGDSAETDEQVPTTEPEPAKEHDKLRFKARVDRTDLDVELDPDELPTIYQKAQVTDRLQGKLAKLNPLVEKTEHLARAMGYDSVDAMLDAAEKNYTDNEVARLVQEGVHAEVAKDVVANRIAHRVSEKSGQVDTSAAEDLPPKPATQKRDFMAEVKELMRARPDLKGIQLPEEVAKACAEEGKPLVLAYAEYETRMARAAADKARKEAEKVAKENKVLKHNAAAAARAPVSGVSGGGATDTKPKDDFLRGFDSDDF